MKNILGFVVLAVMCLTACGGLTGKKDELTDISEVKKEYMKSKDEARKKYDGKELTVLGTVIYRSAVNPSIRVGMSSDSEIPVTIPDIECQYEESDPLFKNVSEKQTIKVKGRLRFTDSGMEMKPCKFVPF